MIAQLGMIINPTTLKTELDMLTKQMREWERQADSIEQGKQRSNNGMIHINDLMNMNDMYYVGNIVDVDGDGWVSKAEAQAILDELVNN